MAAFVQDIVFRRLTSGQTLTIFGGFFDGSCSVYFGDLKAQVVDYSEDFIEALVPMDIGEYDVSVVDGSGKKIDAGSVSVVNVSEVPRRSSAKEYVDRDFFSYVVSLLPRGKAFAMWKGSNFHKLLTAISSSFKYTWDTIRSMADAIDPTHTENFNEWEGELNLPVLGIYPDTYEGRRAEIYRVECGNGGCSVGYIKNLLFLMGIDADVYEYTQNPEKFSGYNFGSDDPRFFLKILFHLTSDDFTQFVAGESCAGDYLLDYTQYREEQVFSQVKQSHIKIIYGYDDGIIEGNLVTDNDDVILANESNVDLGISFYESKYIKKHEYLIATQTNEILITEDGLGMGYDQWK